MAWHIFLDEFACGHFETRRSVETHSVELPNSGPSVKMNLQVLSVRCKRCPPKDCTGIVVYYSCGHPVSAGVGMWRCQQQPPPSPPPESDKKGEEKNDKDHHHQNPKYLAVPLPDPCDRRSCDKQVRLKAIQTLSASEVRRLEANDYSRWTPVIPPRTS